VLIVVPEHRPRRALAREHEHVVRAWPLRDEVADEHDLAPAAREVEQLSQLLDAPVDVTDDEVAAGHSAHALKHDSNADEQAPAGSVSAQAP
jgi:hypothetical protein